jgi:hypothetical protein
MSTTKQKLPLRERRYKAALAAVERCKRRREAAIRTLAKCETLLPKLERRARRMGAPPRPPKIKLDDPPPVELPAIPPKVAADGLPDFLRRGQAAQAAADKAIDEAKPAKPKRQRHEHKVMAEVERIIDQHKPTAGSPGPALLTEALNRPARDARMQAMGFRKTTRKRAQTMP